MTDKKEFVYVWSGKFNSEEEAKIYAEPQWEPEPGEEVSDEEYRKWEDRNPIHQMQDDLGVNLDEDHMEVNFKESRYDDLKKFLVHKEKINEMIENSKDHNTIVLVFEAGMAFLKDEAQLKGSKVLKYLGKFEATFEHYGL